MKRGLTLVLGGARSGKSSYALSLAAGPERVLFVATAQAGDQDMERRIRIHRAQRPDHWDTLEEPITLVEAVEGRLNSYDTIVLDCLTLWVSNMLLMYRGSPSAQVDIVSETRRLLDLYRRGEASWIIVSNEVGLGVVPATELGRVYADELGRVNQTVAAGADEVFFMAAGLPLRIKPKSAMPDTDEVR